MEGQVPQVLQAGQQLDLPPTNKLVLVQKQEFEFLKPGQLVCFRQEMDPVVG